MSAPLVIGGVSCWPPVVLAPLAGITNPPFRLLCRRMGAGMVVTEMISSEGLAFGGKTTLAMLDIRHDEHPVSVQLYGKHPEMLARAAVVVQEAGADMVDVNMGCPMRKVVASGHGAALLRDPDRVHAIVTAMAGAVDIPVTIKMRAGWTDSNAVEVASAVEDAGGAAVTIHGRTRSDMFEGHADFETIAAVKRAVAIPVIGNGDVRDPESGWKMMRETGCDGVMIGRGCMGYPWVFREMAAAFDGAEAPEPPTLEERRQVIGEHLHLYHETYGEERTCREIRKHLLWYFRETPGIPALKRAMADLTSVDAVERAIDAAIEACRTEDVVFKRGLEKHPNQRQAKKRKKKPGC